MKLAIDRIIVSKDNPRQSFDEESLRRLGESIQNHGQLQPIIVRPRGGDFELVVGERRLRASVLVGLETIDAEVRNTDDVTAMELRLIENTQREDLTDAEKGDAVLALWANYEKYKTLKDVTEAIDASYDTVRNHWIPKAKKLSPKLRSTIGGASFSDTHAGVLLKYNHDTQDKLAGVSIKNNLTKRQLIELTKLHDADPQADLDVLVKKVLGVVMVEVPKELVTPELQAKMDEKRQLAKIRKIRPPTKRSKPLTKEQVVKKFAKKKIEKSYRFERVKVSTGTKTSKPTLKREIKPTIIHNENAPDYSLCKCANCPLFGKHCQGRCWD